jgi:hypothetical protein
VRLGVYLSYRLGKERDPLNEMGNVPVGEAAVRRILVSVLAISALLLASAPGLQATAQEIPTVSVEVTAVTLSRSPGSPNGTIVVSGIATCSPEPSQSFLDVYAFQRQGRLSTSGYEFGPIDCSPSGTFFTKFVDHNEALPPFRPGHVRVSATLYAIYSEMTYEVNSTQIYTVSAKP